MSKQGLKRLQFQRLGKRIESSTTASARLGNSEERTIVAFACSCCGKPPRVLVEQFVWRLKKRFRWSWKSCSNNIQSSYDLRSYHLNFDKGWSRQRWFWSNRNYYCLLSLFIFIFLYIVKVPILYKITFDKFLMKNINASKTKFSSY